ncbi:histidine-type phosphatase [Corynebacterium bouchesdurhonense]|uniref:histidine-type phosphatase n=1 Tax=Corynebacterium bouchesdurhonense TaxID=1720192 RepID=UPI00082F3C46|nr:histidine-type phosphatase [Corynebacterium bouchesdurhonense]
MPLTLTSRGRAIAIAAPAATAISLAPATAAEAQTYYSTKQPYSPAAPISSYSQAPAGFHQIYTTSVDRHGSRGLSGFKYDDLAAQMLAAAKDQGQLTELGERLIPQVEAMSKANRELTGPGRGGYGNLTTYGREELRGIGTRNAARNLDFLGSVAASGTDKVKFMSSGADRAVESGQLFGRGVLSVVPGLSDNLVDGTTEGTVNLEERFDLLHAHSDKNSPRYEGYSEYLKSDQVTKKIEAAQNSDASRKASLGLLSKIFDQKFIADIDNGTLKITGQSGKKLKGVADAALQFYNLYIISPAMEDEPAKPAEGWIFDQYMDDEDGKQLAYLLDVESFYENGPGIEGQTTSYDIYEPLLEEMIQGVKDRAAGGTTAAEYRFGHAETIMPLAALLKLPGSEKGVPADQIMDYSNSTWRGDKVAPMGSNIQWDAYQNDEGVTLVRMLYNEAEIPFHDGCMPVADNSQFYTIEELADCLPLGSTSDHSKARPNIAPAAVTGDRGSSLSSAGSSTGGTAALVLAVLAALSAVLGLGAVHAGLIQLPALPALPPLPL